MGKFLPVLLVVFGIIGMIDVSSGLKCYQCLYAPDQPAYTNGKCESLTEKPTDGENLDCTGELSAQAQKGVQAVKDYSEGKDYDIKDKVDAFVKGDSPTCVLAYGTYEGKQYIARDCAKINPKVVGICTTLPAEMIPKLQGKPIENVVVCACNVDGCNGEKETADLLSTLAPTTPPTTTLKELTSDNNSDDTTRIQFSPITWILAASFFIYVKMVVN